MSTPTPDQPERPRKYPPPDAPMPPQQPPTYSQQPTYFAPQQPMYPQAPQQGWAPHQNAAMPPTYLVLSIIAVLGSCLFGIIGIYFSTQVTQRWNAGDVEGAKKASQTALIMGVIGVVIGVIFLFATLAAGGY